MFLKLLISVLLVFSSFFLYADESLSEIQSGNNFVESVVAEYETEHYRPFLEKLHKKYEKGCREHNFDAILDERKENAEKIDVEQLNSNGAITKATKEFANQLECLETEKNQKLSKIAHSYPEASISKAISELNEFSATSEQKKGLKLMHSILPFMFKGDGKTPLENCLIKIDIEYRLKERLLLEKYAKRNTDYRLLQKEKIALQLEKLTKMKAASQEYPEEDLSKMIDEVIIIYPKSLSIRINHHQLLDLGMGKITPKNEAESKVKAIMEEYLQKRTHLNADFFSKN